MNAVCNDTIVLISMHDSGRLANFQTQTIANVITGKDWLLYKSTRSAA